METDETSIKTETPSQASTTSSTPVPTPLASVTATTAAATTTTTSTKTKLPSIVLPEVDLYLHLLVLLFAIDRQKYKQVINDTSRSSLFLSIHIYLSIFSKGHRLSRKNDG